jgi:hypothetical protein
MGDGTEPRGDDLLAIAEELNYARQKVARLEAENESLRLAWGNLHNFVRHDFTAAVENALDDFMRKCSAFAPLAAARKARSVAYASAIEARQGGDPQGLRAEHESAARSAAEGDAQ